MTNQEHLTHNMRNIGGTLIAAAGATLSWVHEFEHYVRIAGSLVAIASGITVIWFTIADHNKKRNGKPKKKEHKYEDHNED